MKCLEPEIIYEDKDVLVVNKPAGTLVFNEKKSRKECLINFLLKKYPYLKRCGNPPRYGVVHRLDKETSGVLLIAKNNNALIFLQKQFKERKVVKKYIALVVGKIKDKEGVIKTLIGRSPKNRKKQRVYLPQEPRAAGKREAITEYRTLKRFKNYTLLEINLKTGRRHQIRCHLAYLQHPIVGDSLYGFKNQPLLKNLDRQFLHASKLRIKLPSGKTKEFKSKLPLQLKKILQSLN